MIIDPSNALAAPGSSRGYARLSVADGSIAASATPPSRLGPGASPRVARGSASESLAGSGERRLRRGWGSRASGPPSPQVQTPTASGPLRRPAPLPASAAERGEVRPFCVRASVPSGDAPSAVAPGASAPPLRGRWPPVPRRRDGPRLPESAPAPHGRGRLVGSGRARSARLSAVSPSLPASRETARPARRPLAARGRFPAGPRGRVGAPGRSRGAARGGSRDPTGRPADRVRPSPSARALLSSRTATSDRTWRPAEFKHISQRRKRN